MKKALMVVMAVALVIGFAGCDIFGGAVDYYPAKEGNIATSTVVTHDSTWMAFDSSSVVNDSTWDNTSECMGKTTLEDETEVWEFKNQDGAYSYMGFDKDGDKVNFYSDKTDSAFITVWPYTLELGTKWTLGEGDYAVNYEVVEENVEVTVPAGTYSKTLKVSMTPKAVENVTYEGYMWMDKKHGTVKVWFKTVTDITDVMYMEMESTTELKSFE
ncbi:hypothetical protein JXM67_10565 [candidate division WOR-3 bacterium]|nr:hypothetical protein [candidate division WOR-3 bacterium]